MSRKRFAFIGFGITILFLLYFSFANALSSAKGPKFGVQTTLDNDRHPGWFIYELKPGDIYEDSITIVNLSDQNLHFRLYPQDAENISKEKGAFKILDENQVPEDRRFIQKWITMEKDTLDMKPYSKEVIKFTVRIPKDAEKREYAGVVFTHLDPKMRPEEVKREGVTFLIATRVGIRVYLTVTDTPSMPKRFEKEAHDGTLFAVLKYILFGITTLFTLYFFYSIFLARKK